MMMTCQSLTALFGRLFLAAIFLASGFMKIGDWSGTSAGMEQKGMVAVPFFLAMAILFEIVGGLSVLLGFFTRWGAAALVIFLIPTTLIFHNFWIEQGMAQMNQMQHFMKNLTIMGGLLMVAAFGPGRYSIDHWMTGASRAQRPMNRQHREPMPVG
jgi:putative oxidoreductase